MGWFDRIRSDVQFAVGLGRTLRRVIPLARDPLRVWPDVAAELAAKYGDRPALLSERETLTYAGLDAHANRYARWAVANGIDKGDTVCLMMPNRPEFMAIWLGIARAGGVTALLNINLTGRGLAYCIDIVRPRHVIVADELAEIYATAAPLLASRPMLWRHGGDDPLVPSIDAMVAGLDDGPLLPEQRPPLSHNDRCLYIYTSGTTGLPKAATINHYRVLAAMEAFSAATNASADDRMYDCLPMYHTVGGVCAPGAALIAGGSVWIAERFSASAFWDDVVDRGCTLFQYIGELCRYLVNAPPHPKERLHKVRLCCGNGLRPDIWPEFKRRFAIPHIREFYAATEGNAVLFNFDDTPGAIGRCPWWARIVFPMAVVRFDLDREQPVRDAEGRCIRCAPGEVGELISHIVLNPLKPGQRFDGYADPAATEAKILRNVFRPGDEWFRSGDLVRRDRRGYYFFVDRVGDTYRWKGENVSTSEVAETIHTCAGVAEANIYGVAVAGQDGRAGMAAVVSGVGFDLVVLRAHVHAHLPPHARPLFVRLQEQIDSTSTFKQRKIRLVQEGFDPDQVADPIYFDDGGVSAYLRLDSALFHEIQSGRLRL
jgi:fatty-acyl-CoA synthase